mmetsp:Transcript_4777/g.11611  ORF Transcript_4777/g.11611 Transcript_4777/m.11611 type:complete len:204 (-) Transcript_4777:176-787(-)
MPRLSSRCRACSGSSAPPGRATRTHAGAAAPPAGSATGRDGPRGFRGRPRRGNSAAPWPPPTAPTSPTCSTSARRRGRAERSTSCGPCTTSTWSPCRRAGARWTAPSKPSWRSPARHQARRFRMPATPCPGTAAASARTSCDVPQVSGVGLRSPQWRLRPTPSAAVTITEAACELGAVERAASFGRGRRALPRQAATKRARSS